MKRTWSKTTFGGVVVLAGIIALAMIVVGWLAPSEGASSYVEGVDAKSQARLVGSGMSADLNAETIFDIDLALRESFVFDVGTFYAIVAVAGRTPDLKVKGDRALRDFIAELRDRVEQGRSVPSLRESPKEYPADHVLREFYIILCVGGFEGQHFESFKELFLDLKPVARADPTWDEVYARALEGEFGPWR